MCKRVICLVSLVLALGLTGQASAADPDLKGWWPLDGDATDGSGNGLDGVLFNGPVFGEGKLGGAVMFDGVDDRVEMPGTSLAEGFPSFEGEVTWAVWFKTPGGARGTVIAHNPPGGAHVSGNRQLNVETSGFLRIRANSQGALNNFNSSMTVNDDEWHHAAITIAFEPIGTNDSMKVYIDGDLGSGYELDTVDINSRMAASADFIFMLGYNAGAPFLGSIDDARVYSRVLTVEEIQLVMLGSAKGVAQTPAPANEATDVARDSHLNWGAGEFAAAHNVYLGTSFDDANNATVDNPGAVVLGQGLSDTGFDPGRLEFDQTYYWRVDEVNSAPDRTVFKGDTWSFTTEPFSIPVNNITATASGSFGSSVAENTINGSGLVDDLHGIAAPDMWISTGIPATIEYAFDRAYKLHELWIWNSNQSIEPFIGFGAKDVVIEHSLDGENWAVLEGVGPLAQASGRADYAHNSTIDFGGAVAQHVRLTINSVQGFAPQASLSEVRFFAIPTFATRPTPDSGAANLAPDLTLSWGRNGREAGGHDIYLGSDPNALSLAGSVTESSFDTLASDLQLGQTYYWQVVEVNDAMDPMEWAGDVWSFTTVDTITVDDMEIYKDEEFFEIWATWSDGFDDPGNNGAVVGADPSLGDFSPETTIVHGGSQSLPIHFDNSGAPRSEATRTFDAAMDWAGHGVQGLVLYFQGSPSNTGGSLYIKINDTKVAYDGDASNLMRFGWNKWYISLADVSGTNLSRVTSLTIGTEGGGTGVVYVDDILLTPDARELITPVDPGNENLALAWNLNEGSGTVAADSSGNGHDGALTDFDSATTNWITGLEGSALLFNSAAFVETAYPGITGTASRTCCAWIMTSEANRTIMSWGLNTAGKKWRMRLDVTGGLRVEVNGGYHYGRTFLADDEWHHVAVTLEDDGTANVLDTLLYVDGLPEITAASLGQPTDTDPAGVVRIGKSPYHDAGFFGIIDEARIYDRALSAGEVAGLAGRTEPFDRP